MPTMHGENVRQTRASRRSRHNRDIGILMVVPTSAQASVEACARRRAIARRNPAAADPAPTRARVRASSLAIGAGRRRPTTDEQTWAPSSGERTGLPPALAHAARQRVRTPWSAGEVRPCRVPGELRKRRNQPSSSSIANASSRLARSLVFIYFQVQQLSRRTPPCRRPAGAIPCDPTESNPPFDAAHAVAAESLVRIHR